jgi:hypothetical protein
VDEYQDEKLFPGQFPREISFIVKRSYSENVDAEIFFFLCAEKESFIGDDYRISCVV